MPDGWDRPLVPSCVRVWYCRKLSGRACAAVLNPDALNVCASVTDADVACSLMKMWSFSNGLSHHMF